MKNVFFNIDIFYTRPVCPYVFLNSNLAHMGLFHITNSLIFKNRLVFMNIDNHKLPSFGLNIRKLKELEISIVFDELTLDIICPKIFLNLKLLVINGAPYRIQTNLFKFYANIEYVIFYIENLKSLFHLGIEWMSYLNWGLNVNINDLRELRENLNRFIIVQFNEINSNHWTSTFIYSDKDLCLFRKFPHKQLIIPAFTILNEIECSCTLIWLIKNHKIFETFSLTEDKMRIDFSIYFKNSSVIQCLKNFTTLFESCRFDEKFNNFLI